MLIRVDRLWNWPFQRKSCCSTRFHGIEAELFAEWKSWETLGYQDQDHCALLWNIVHLSTDDTHIAFEIRLKALYKPTVGEICALNLCCTGKEGNGWPLGRRWIGQTCLACVADSLAPRPSPSPAASIQHRAAIQTPYLTSATYFPFLLWPQLCICRNSTLCRRRGIAFHLFIFDNVQQQNTACTALCWTFISEFECCQS